MNAAIDVCSVLATIRVPTLIIHRRDDARIKFSGGQYLAEKIPGARFVEFPGRDHPVGTGDIDPIIDEIEEFLTGVRPAPTGNRVLATVRAIRLVSPVSQAARLGDRAWQERTDKLRGAATQVFSRYDGQLGTVSPEELIGQFDGPARAVRCALALQDIARGLGLDLAAGVHKGEIELLEKDFAGLTVMSPKEFRATLVRARKRTLRRNTGRFAAACGDRRPTSGAADSANHKPGCVERA